MLTTMTLTELEEMFANALQGNVPDADILPQSLSDYFSRHNTLIFEVWTFEKKWKYEIVKLTLDGETVFRVSRTYTIVR